MSKLLSDEELREQVGNIIQGYAYAKRQDLSAAQNEVMGLIQSQKKAHADAVIGEEPKDDPAGWREDTLMYEGKLEMYRAQRERNK